MSRLRPDRVPRPVMTEGDARIQALQSVVEPPSLSPSAQEFIPAARAVAPAPRAIPAAEIDTPEAYVAEINRLWGSAQGTFLEIGRLLIQAKETLPHGTYSDAVEANLPFSANTGYQLREAARWAMEGQIPPDRLPSSYSTIYQLSTLEPRLLEAASKEGVIRPALTRAELLAWKKKMTTEADKSVQDRRIALGQRISRLKREAARIATDLRRAEQEMAALDAARTDH